MKCDKIEKFLGVSVVVIVTIITLFLMLYTLPKSEINNGRYVFNQLELITYYADHARGKENIKMNKNTIDKLNERFISRISMFDETKDYKFSAHDNKLQVSGNVTYTYFHGMNEVYNNQLSGISRKFNFNSDCQEKELDRCNFIVSEK